MKTQQQRIRETYDWLDKLIRASLGEFPDFSGAVYDGDYSLTLEQAQCRKHDYILRSVKFEPGMRVLDIGSGWSPMLKKIKERGGYPVGITLSPVQAAHSKRHGFDVFLGDWKDLNPDDLGLFGAVISVGAFEHFCNIDEYRAGEQDAIYKEYFSFVNKLLPVGGRHYLQTMTWGRNHPQYEDISLNAPIDSPEYIVAHLNTYYVSSGWLPYGVGHIMENANGFELISANSGRLDYIRTLAHWREQFQKASVRKIAPMIEIAIRYLASNSFRDRMRSSRTGAQLKAFENEVFEHTRMVLEKSS
ncbi:MAG: class I SAM-dependent methyltransferase [Chloroflexi bacterium]|nr:class I SAM-dependent methyltransferase [Chloroflexota bacterium]